MAWRRFFARSFDIYLETLLIAFIFGLIFGKYSWYIKVEQLLEQSNNYLYGFNSPDSVFGIVFLPFSLILNAFICSYFGTSFGKYLLGINVNKVEKMSLKDWLIRSFRLWRSGFAFGIPILSLWTFNREQKLINKHEQTTYDKLSEISVTANKLSKFQIARAFVIISTFFIVYFSAYLYIQKNDNSIQNLKSSTYYWQNPITKFDALINGDWKNKFDKNDDGQTIYTFTDNSNRTLVVFALEDIDNASLNQYVDLLKIGVENDMIFSDGGLYLQREGYETWECFGTLKSIKESLLHVEIRKNGSNFWRIVSIQNRPYDYTQEKVEQLKFQLWKTISPTQNQLQ